MNISREAKKAEAIRRMKALKYFDLSIKDFEKNDKVMINEPPFGAHFYIDDDERLVEAIKSIEDRDNILVYAVVRAFTSLGTMDSLLFVEDYEDEWGFFDEDANDGIIMSYTINYDMPDCSEYGSIGFRKSPAAGLIRTA